MITKFSILTKDNIRVCIYLGVNVNKYEYINKELVQKVVNSKYNGISWEANNKSISLIEDQYEIIGYPTPDMTKVVAIYPIEHPTYPSPNNCVIYNEDGTVYKKLHPPKLISDLAKQFYRNPNGPHVPEKIFFERAAWREDSKGKIVPAIEIGFRREFSETRAYDIETGEFGEVLSTSKN